MVPFSSNYSLRFGSDPKLLQLLPTNCSSNAAAVCSLGCIKGQYVACTVMTMHQWDQQVSSHKGGQLPDEHSEGGQLPDETPAASADEDVVVVAVVAAVVVSAAVVAVAEASAAGVVVAVVAAAAGVVSLVSMGFSAGFSSAGFSSVEDGVLVD